MTLKTKRVLTEISKYKIYKLQETYLKEEFPAFIGNSYFDKRDKIHFPTALDVKSKGGEGLCRMYSIAFLVSGCREPIGGYRFMSRSSRNLVSGILTFMLLLRAQH